MNARSTATAPGSSTASGLETSTSSPVVARVPALMLAAKLAGRAFSITRAPSASTGPEPGVFAITTTSSTCGTSAGSDSSELRAVAVGDDDGGDVHAASTSR